MIANIAHKQRIRISVKVAVRRSLNANWQRMDRLLRAGISNALAVWRQLHEAFAIELVICLIAEENLVAARNTERGVFRAPFQRQPATGKSYELLAMEWFQFRDRKICRRWGARDHAAQARQVGLKIA